MQFSAAHKNVTYLMVAAAFVALIGGGSVDPIVSILGAVGLVASYWVESPRFDLQRHQLGWNIASFFALLYALLHAVGGNLLTGGVTLIVFLVVAKACQRRTNRDWAQLTFLSVAMLIAASVLNTGMLFGVCFVVFVLASTWAFILLHLRGDIEANFLVRDQEEATRRASIERIFASRRIVDRKFFWSTGLVSLVVFVAAVMLFLSIPRVGFGFLGKAKQQFSMVGFSDGVQLGDHGTLKSDPTIVMRVKVGKPYAGRGAPPLHWRGVAFDTYHKGQWSRSRRAPQTEVVTLPLDDKRIRRELAVANNPRLPPPVKQEIWLDPLDSNVLFAASMPTAFEHAVPLGRRPPQAYERNDEIRFERKDAIHYVAYSQLAEPDPELLRTQTRVAVPANFEVYRQLSDDITPRTRDLALRLTAGATNDYDKAQAIATWLKTQLGYTVEMVSPGEFEPVDFFLFERKKGHCEYFASAFVILARAAGLHARQVNGFYGGEWNEYDNYVAVRAGDAHSWAEVYFPAAGWVTFDPTPSGGDVLGRGADGAMARLRRFMDSVRFQWSRWVVDYNLGSQLGLLKQVGASFSAAMATLKSGLRQSARWFLDHLALLLGGAALVAGLWWLRRWRPRRAGAQASMWHKNYARAHELLERYGFHRHEAVTPREFAEEVLRRDEAFGQPFFALTELYYARVWGGQDVPPERWQSALDALARVDQQRRASK